ncbi:MAG: hypothetical protein K9G30_04115 [Parvibaculum sp.]|nr:hypothetical protein [Parvibaculum sp.]
MGKSKQFKDRLLVELWRAQQTKGLTSFLDAKTVADAAGLEYSPGQLRLCVTEFRDHGYINAAFTMGGGSDGGLGFSMTQSGVEEAEELEEELINDGEIDEITPSSVTDSRDDIPAADRLVRLDDNKPAFEKLQHDLIELFDALKANEQETNLSDEDRLFLIGQLDSARRMIEASPVVTISGLTEVLIPPIRFIADRVTAGIIGNKATELLNILVQFL